MELGRPNHNRKLSSDPVLDSKFSRLTARERLILANKEYVDLSTTTTCFVGRSIRSSVFGAWAGRVAQWCACTNQLFAAWHGWYGGNNAMSAVATTLFASASASADDAADDAADAADAADADADASADDAADADAGADADADADADGGLASPIGGRWLCCVPRALRRRDSRDLSAIRTAGQRLDPTDRR